MLFDAFGVPVISAHVGLVLFGILMEPLNTHTQYEYSAFFRTVPDLAARKAVVAPQKAATGRKHLKVV